MDSLRYLITASSWAVSPGTGSTLRPPACRAIRASAASKASSMCRAPRLRMPIARHASRCCTGRIGRICCVILRVRMAMIVWGIRVWRATMHRVATACFGSSAMGASGLATPSVCRVCLLGAWVRTDGPAAGARASTAALGCTELRIGYADHG